MSIKTSAELQYTVLSSIIKDTQLMTLAYRDISLEFFDDRKYQFIYKLLYMYFNKYNKVPTIHEMLVMTTQYHEEPYGDLVDIQDLVKACYAAPRADERFIIDNITDFIKRAKFEKILVSTITKYQDNKEFDIEDTVDKIMNTYQFELKGVDVYNPKSIEDYMKSRKKALGDNENPIIIKSFMNGLNKVLQYKGYKYGDLSTVVAAPGCFTGDTRIMTLDGKSHTLEEMYNSEYKGIYGCSKSGDIVTGLYDSVYLSDYTGELVEVTIDKKYKIRCTPDHPFMLRSGEYKRADNLNVDDMLMSISRSSNKASSSTVTNVELLKLDNKVPVYGIVDAGEYGNYALALSDEEGVFVSNTGKSTLLVQEGTFAALQGYHVLHIILGDMSEYSIINKMMASITGIEINKFTDDLTLYEKVLNSDPKLKLIDPLSRIRVLAYAPGEVSVTQLSNIVKQVQESENIHFDLIIVDYADNLAEETDQMYSNAGKIYDRLKGLAQNNKSVVITASQPKIGYYEEEVIPFTGLAESSRKQQIVDICLALGKPRRDANIATVHCAKLREGETGTLLRLKLDMACNHMEEVTSDEYFNIRAELMDPNKRTKKSSDE